MTSLKTNLIREMLLIEEPSIFRLYTELSVVAKYFIAPVFTVALILEFFGEMNFLGVIKKLVLVTVFISAFYQIHTTAVDASLETASDTLRKVSPRNLFVRKWYEPKVRTAENKSWGILERLAIPNLNDFLATAFFLLSKAFIWLLKLIYSTVFHLTYVFSGITAVLYFLGWTQDSLKGTIQASLWCIILPFVVVAILALVGNSFNEQALHGALAVSSIDNLIWLFGVTLLLLISPAITFGMVKGDGLHSFGAKMGNLVVSGGMQAAAMAPLMMRFANKAQYHYRNVKNTGTKAFHKVKGGVQSLKSSNKDSSTRIDSNSLNSKNSNILQKDNQAKAIVGGPGIESKNNAKTIERQTTSLGNKNQSSNSTSEKIADRKTVQTKQGKIETQKTQNQGLQPKATSATNRITKSNRVEAFKGISTPIRNTAHKTPSMNKPNVPRRDNELR